MSNIHTLLRYYFLLFAFTLFGGIITNNQAIAQGCVSFYGPTGEPSLGLNRKLCVVPGNINLDATPIILGATYSWAGGSTNAILNVTAAGTYTVTVYDNPVTDSCVLNFVVTSFANPIVSLGNDTSFCVGDTVTLRAQTGYPDYIWSDGFTTDDSLVVSVPDTYSVTVTDTNQCSGVDSVIVTEDPLPTPNLGPDTSMCPTNSVTLDAGAGYLAYLWSDGSVAQTLTTAIPGGYVVSVTDANGCVGFDQINVSNDTLPLVNIGLDDSICDGGVKVLNAGGGYFSYLWSDATTQQTASFTTTSDPWVEVTDNNGCMGRDTMHLEIFPLPIVNLGPDAEFCVNDSVILDAGPGMVSYSWNNGTPTQTLAVTNAGTYSVTVEDSNQCFNSDTNFVSQNALPIVNIGPDIEYCTGSTFTQLVDGTTPGAALYTWMDGVFVAIRNITQNNDTVWLQVLDTNGCVNRDTLYVIENPLPPLNIGPDDTICSSQIYSLNAGNPGGTIATYNWSTGSPNQSISIPPNPNQINDSTASYSVTITDNNGCVSMDTMELHTYALPVPDLGNDTAFCTGDPFAMTLDPGVFAAYNWSTGAVSQTINIGAIGMLYSVTVTDTRGCINDDNITVIDNPLPLPNLGPDEAFCQGTSYTKILNPGGFVSYLWSDGSTGQVLGVSTAGLFDVIVTDVNGCMNSDDILITENPTPQVDLGADRHFCEDDTFVVFLDATTMLPGGGFNFLWNNGATTSTLNASAFGTYGVLVTDQTTGCFGSSSMDIIAMEKADPDLGEDGLVCQGQLIVLSPKVNIAGYNYTWSTGATTATINVFETGTYWVRLDAINGTCVNLTDTVHYSPGVLPVVELGPDQYICDGQTVMLLNESTAFPNSDYEWQDGSTDKEYIATTTGTYEVAVTNQCGSVVDQVYLEFQDCANVYYPNSFSPNGDNRNETFYPKTDQEFKEYGFWIYDRWGDLVFKTNVPNFGWDGKVNGKAAQPGVYVWRISYVSSFQEYGERIEKTGNVTLVR